MIRKTGVRSFKPGVLLVLSLIVVTLVQAQPREALHEDAWALQFRITSDFTIAAFQGAMISAKHHMAPDRALRYGLSLNGGFQNERQTQNDTEVERDQNSQQLTLSVQYIGYPALGEDDRNIYLYLGAGPEIAIGRHQVNNSSMEQTAVDWRVAAGGLIGAEWFVGSRISLMAEYKSSLGFSRRRTNDELDEREQTVTRIQLGNGGVRFGVSLYVR